MSVKTGKDTDLKLRDRVYGVKDKNNGHDRDNRGKKILTWSGFLCWKPAARQPGDHPWGKQRPRPPEDTL